MALAGEGIIVFCCVTYEILGKTAAVLLRAGSPTSILFPGFVFACNYVYYAVKERIQSNVDTGLAGLDTRGRLFEELVEDTEVLSDLPPE